MEQWLGKTCWAEVYENVILQMVILFKFPETKVANFDDYAFPKVESLNFKDKQYDWRRSNYPFRDK